VTAAVRIAINVQLKPNRPAGGVRRVLSGLIRGLGELHDGPEEYVIIGSSQGVEWIRPLLGPNQEVRAAPADGLHLGRRAALAHAVQRTRTSLPDAASLAWTALRSLPGGHGVPISAGFYESLGCDLIHFPYQQYVFTRLPSVYNPHDLQHLHLPEFFDPPAVAWREATFRAGCRDANTVVVSSEWGRQDIARHYGTSPTKIQVIPWATGTGFDRAPDAAELDEVARRYQLPVPYMFYPAVAWPHKNHRRLVEAIARLRDRDGLCVNLVCTGGDGDSVEEVRSVIAGHRLGEQVRVLGTVAAADMRALFRMARFVVIPTLFEATSGPVREAWFEGVAVACSAVTALPEQVGDAAWLFDPNSVEAIAGAIRKMTTDDALREDLVRRGKERVRRFTWDRTARAYRAVYRHVAGKPLDESERHLLGSNWYQASVAGGVGV